MLLDPWRDGLVLQGLAEARNGYPQLHQDRISGQQADDGENDD